MKRILSLLCALLLLCSLVPAAVAEGELDYVLSKSLSMHSLMLEQAGLTSFMYGESLGASIRETAAQFVTPATGVQMLFFEADGSSARFVQTMGEELPAMSEALAATYDRSVPGMLITQLVSSYGDMNLAAASALKVSSTGVFPGMQTDALVVLDFGTAYQLVCTFVTGDDGIVLGAAQPLKAEADVIAAFCEAFELSPDSVKHFPGEVLYQASAADALRSHTLSMKNVLADVAAQQADPDNFGYISPELVSFVKNMAGCLAACSKPARVRLLKITDENHTPAVQHALLKSLVNVYHGCYLGTQYAAAADYITASSVLDMPRGMSPAVIVQADYEAAEDGAFIPAFSVVSVFTPQDDSVLCTASYALYDNDFSFLDALLSGEIGCTVDSALVQELQP